MLAGNFRRLHFRQPVPSADPVIWIDHWNPLNVPAWADLCCLDTGLELSGDGGWTPPPVRLRTLILGWKSALNFNPWAKFQTFRQLTPSSFRSIPTLPLQPLPSPSSSTGSLSSVFKNTTQNSPLKTSRLVCGGMTSHQSHHVVVVAIRPRQIFFISTTHGMLLCESPSRAEHCLYLGTVLLRFT